MNDIKLAFDDVLLAPRYSDIESRSLIDISSELYPGYKLKIPIISSPMDTVTSTDMAIWMDRLGALGIVHRYNSVKEQVELARGTYIGGMCSVGAAVGVTGDFLERAQSLASAGVNIICIDAAHGHHILMKKAIIQLRKHLGYDIHIMAGNVATPEGFQDLVDWGADSIRVGIGGGSICTTRIKTGHGIPTFQSILDCADYARTSGVKLIVDGGIKNSGDIVKALAAGADFVMIGSLLAGTEESPGATIIDPNTGRKYKKYRGMASFEAQEDFRGPTYHVEGISSRTPYCGSVVEVINNLSAGIKSGFSYSGSANLKELRERAKFIRQSDCSTRESSAHILLRNE
jgi:IMP dehydrogenase